MSAEIIPFCFESESIRVISKDGDPWFVAKDVCEILGLTNPSMALESLDFDERAKFNLGRQGDTNIISESGLYVLILRCRDAVKPGTIPYRFRKWVTSEVLPQIRRTGSYEITPCNRKETTINYQNLNKLKNPKRMDIRYTVDLTKMINKPTRQGMEVLSVLTGLDFSAIEEALPDKGKMVTLDDYFHRFVDELYEVDEQARIGATELYETWIDWVRRNKLVECNVSMRTFGMVVGEYYSRSRYADGVYYLGLRPKGQETEEVV